MSKRHRNQFFKLLSAGLLVSGLLSGCASRLDIRGDLPDPSRLSAIKKGKQTREQVVKLLGSPSSVAPFGDETWFYIAERTETFAFFEPELMKRQVVVIKFNKKGVVSDIKTLNKKEGNVVRPVKRITPTSGSEIGIFQQLIGNLGRFQK
jgi:outer membrane protein assembly factor BamE (lipoprotein component of BamABCDE complex)